MAACALLALPLGAQSVAPRITSEIADSEQATLRGSLHPLALSRFDAGRMPSDTKLNGVSLVFSRSAAQEADLEALLAAQQNPASPLYHQWLNPDQFAARFGVAEADLAKVKSWLEQQGFSVDSVARGRSMVRFSGTARQVEGAFSTEMHYYNVEGSRHFAPATELSVPAALAPVVLAVGNLNDFRLKPMHIVPAHPDYTSGQSGAVHFAPGDIAKVYDINLWNTAGHNGAGQSIAIVGQSAIVTSDIENFQSAAHLSIKDPTLVIVPGSGTSTIYTGDESESDIDLEWSGAVAPGASLVFVYVGNNLNTGVFDSLEYAVDKDIAPIISISYGACETALTQSEVNTIEAIGKRAIAQGQTIIVSSGDSGSTACSGYTGTTDGGVTFTTAMEEALAVSYPASSAYVTAMGGTEITAAEDVTGPYWEAASGSDLLTSALQYIPEVAWNDDNLGNGLSSSGGGASALIPRPAWQTGTIGGSTIPGGTMRLIPDIALYSSPNYPGYLFCSSDSESGILGSCSSGFRDANSKYLTVAGGTSFAAPVFAGMVALLNQAKGYTSGQGLLNPTLYAMAANSATYASAFHDTPTGSNNDCDAGSSYCTGEIGYSTGPGYDEVTGLGSVDLAKLIEAWTPAQVVSTLIGTTTTITASSSTPALNATDTFTITVTAADGSTPTGSIAISVDSGAAVTVNLNPGSTAGTATGTYQEAFATSGTHQIVAQFAQTATLASSAGTVQVTVPTTGGFTLSASGITVAQGSEGTLTITVAPSGGYTGTVDITPTNSSLSFCYSTTTATVSGTAAVQTSMIIDLKVSDCGLSNTQGGSGTKLFQSGSQKANLSTHASPSIAAAAFSFAGLFLAGLLGWRRRQLRLVCGLLVLGIAGLALSACGGGSSSSSSTSTSTGTKYTITLTGQDSASSAFSATTTFTLTVK
jgi:subtilase family serine protease